MAGFVATSILAGGFAWADRAEAARILAIKGNQLGRYGRIALTFDSAVPVKARISGLVLLVTFGERSNPVPEKITADMPDFVSMVRRDPDGTGLRIALQRPYRLNVQTAGEHVFIDLLPEDWQGLPPPLPPEIVAELVRRTQVAEAAMRAAAPVVEPKRLPLELSRLPTLTRLSLKLAPETVARFNEAGLSTRLTIPGAWRIDDIAARGRTKPVIESLAVESDAEGAHLTVTPAAGYEIRAARDDDGVTLDLVRKSSPTDAKAASMDLKAQAADMPVRPAGAPVGAMPPKAAGAAPVAPQKVVVLRPAGPGLAFPFQRQPAAALFERAGLATLVFETPDPVIVPAGDPVFDSVNVPRRQGAFVILNFKVPSDRLLDLVPMGDADAPTGWELVAGQNLSASEPLSAIRSPEASGRIGIGIPLPNPGGSTWIERNGERIGIVTGYGPKPAGIPKRQVFVDFELLPSRQGVAVLAKADDLLVRPDMDGVSVGREGGMSVSGVAKPAEPALTAVSDLAIERRPWDAARSGDIGENLREQLNAVVEAPRPARGPLRLNLARSMLANGLGVEALGALQVAASEDPVMAGQRELAILTAVANTEMGRYADARKALDSEFLRTDPEARLWKGYLDAKAGRWPAADTAFRDTASVIERYPDDLQALLRTAAAEAAIENGDWAAAGKQIVAALPRAAVRSVTDRLALLRARIDEVTGQTSAALDAYQRLSDTAERPIASAATLRATVLAHALGKMPVADAIERLETLLLTWHGDEVEQRTVAALAKLNMEAGRWRQAFVASRKADALAPESPISRELHDSAQELFDDLYLSEKGATMSGVEALALYFDFKDFAPIGRRGDEIVRRLADKLVELDLLDSAGELLQHQVDKRLTGPARAGVAARLATIRMMDEKPLQALQVIDATYQPELPEDLRRARALIRARALSDLSRTDLALETIEAETGADSDRLRADILWTGRRWREAGEAHEAMVGEAWRMRKPLDDAMRSDVVRAAIAYGLAGETLGLERLRAKFAEPMAESVDARTFALLTQPNAVRSQAFREIAQKATKAETLQAFLKEYRKRYPDASVPQPVRQEGPQAEAKGNETSPSPRG
ncbi:tetratricopeptide repeat protein [Methylobacterium sp. 77]|uniref:tetratricopeptide repeat protein n=1 Tax=Methylobacterium sp. 77 TaxID=1101192 RepID=UPI0012DFA58E|nr:tetratricopeptide repeat protein [Methylobacterium sp. 77]